MKLPEFQAYILEQMQKGKGLSSLLSTDSIHSREFGGTLEGRYRAVPMVTIKAMLRKGILVEGQRWNVSTTLEHIEYVLPGSDE